jgi:excisionase family DNA binding protein
MPYHVKYKENPSMPQPIPQPDSNAQAALAAVGGHAPLTIQNTATGQTAPLPPEVAALVRLALTSLAAGRTVTHADAPVELTPNEAAAFLRVSRSIVMKLITEGRLSSRLVGSHHRIPATELETYRNATQAIRRAAADALYDLDHHHGPVEGPPPPKSSYRGGGRAE